LALVEPGLIDLRVAELLANIREGPRYLRVSTERFKQLGLRAPILLSLAPQEWASRVARFAQFLNCREERIRREVPRVPQIIGWLLTLQLQCNCNAKPLAAKKEGNRGGAWPRH
jgi:hypothetical protein